MLLCLSYYFVETALCNKATPYPQGSKYCVEAVFLTFSDSFLFFTSHNFYLPFLRVELSCCRLLRTPDVCDKNFGSQYKRSLWNKFFYFSKQGNLDFYFPNVSDHADKDSDLLLLP